MHRIAGMIEGVWLAPEFPVPDHCPYSQASSAILPRAGIRIESEREFVCLDLVLIGTAHEDLAWVVLSEAATYTYGHTIGLNRGERWRFATWSDGARHSFHASYSTPIDPAVLAGLYGEEAAEYARPDRLAIQIHLSRT